MRRTLPGKLVAVGNEPGQRAVGLVIPDDQTANDVLVSDSGAESPLCFACQGTLHPLVESTEELPGILVELPRTRP